MRKIQIKKRGIFGPACGSHPVPTGNRHRRAGCGMGTSPAPDTLWREETRRAKPAERDQAQADHGGYDLQLHHPPAFFGVSIGSAVRVFSTEHPLFLFYYLSL